MDDEYSIIHQCYMESLAEFINSSNESYQTSFEWSDDKLLNTINWKSQTLSFGNSNSDDSMESQNDSSKEITIPPTSGILSFGKLNSSPPSNPKQLYGNLGCSVNPKVYAASPGNSTRYFTDLEGNNYMEGQNTAIEANIIWTKRSYSMTGSTTPPPIQDHIIVERKRREKLTRSIIALSALLPGLKKMDKASVLENAVKHVKELQERLKILEEQTKKRRVESVVCVSKSQVLSADDESSLCDANSGTTPALEYAAAVLPHIEAKTFDNDFFIRIHCEKQQGLVAKIINQVEMLHFSIANSSVLSFGNSIYDITIIAQRNGDCSMTVKDLVRNLRLAFLKFM